MVSGAGDSGGMVCCIMALTGFGSQVEAWVLRMPALCLVIRDDVEILGLVTMVAGFTESLAVTTGPGPWPLGLWAGTLVRRGF
jgi:hypothetical protein